MTCPFVMAAARDTTFGEAYLRTGRLVSITVTANYGPMGGSQPMLLNYLTAPQVLLYSAVAASCALPGLMRPVTLLRKDAEGKILPFHPRGAWPRCPTTLF